MSRWVGLSVLGLLAFLVLLIAFMPARLAFDSFARPAGFEAGLVHGTIWDSQIVRLSAAQLSAREVDAKLDPIGVLSGQARFDLNFADPNLRGTGDVVLTFTETRLEDVDAVMALDAIAALAAAGLARGESARLDIDEISYDHQGQCQNAQGEVFSAVLVATGERYGVDLPALNGTLRCAGADLALDFTGRNDTIDLSGEARMSQAGVSWSVEAQSSDRDIIAALAFLGFEQDGQRYIARSQ